MSHDKPKGLYGKNISTEMRKSLSWQAIFLYDFFQGIWDPPDGKPGIVFVTNKRLAEEFGWSVGTVGRAIKQLETVGRIRRVITDGYAREILPGGVIRTDQGVITPDQGVIKSDQGVDQDGSGGLITSDHNKTLKSKTLKFKREEERAVVRADALRPTKKSKFNLKTSISREGYQELLTRTDLANGDRAWLFSQIESMQDWSANGHLKQDWLATARNWLKRARRSGDIPHGAAPPRHQPKTFKQIDQEEFDDAVNGFLRTAE